MGLAGGFAKRPHDAGAELSWTYSQRATEGSHADCKFVPEHEIIVADAQTIGQYCRTVLLD